MNNHNKITLLLCLFVITTFAFANLTLEAIASKSGFHSRATFISAFKKFTGLTPSYFHKSGMEQQKS